MKSLSWRGQLMPVAWGYTAVFAIAGALVLARYLQERSAGAEAAGGMWAGGDLMLGIFIACLFMIPTFFLVWVMAKSEAAYTTYSQLLLSLGLSGPVCLALFVLDKHHVSESLASVCLCRLASSPFVLVGMGASRLMARFDRPKKLISYALLVEAATLVIAVMLLIRA